MAEYIDRAEAGAVVIVAKNGEDALTALARLPAADVAPVIHAHWEQVEVKEYKAAKLLIASMFCPVCNRYHNEVYHYGDPRHNVNCCPFCGARMDERSEGE